MGGSVKVTIIKPDGNMINGLSYTGFLNDCFFSKDFCEGNIDKALDNFEENLDIKNKVISPYSYGLTVVDFPNKTIRSMQSYDHPFSMRLYGYDREIRNDYIGERDFRYLTEKNLIKIKDEDIGKSFSLEQFFNTLNHKEIYDIIRKIDKNPCGGQADKYKALIDEDIYVQPSIIDFCVKRYEDCEIVEFIKDLIGDGLSFNKEEQIDWLNYVDEDDVSIRENIILIFSKLELNKQLNKDLENNKNKVKSKI